MMTHHRITIFTRAWHGCFNGHLIASINPQSRQTHYHAENLNITQIQFLLITRTYVSGVFFSIELPLSDYSRDRSCYGLRLPEEPGGPKQTTAGGHGCIGVRHSPGRNIFHSAIQVTHTTDFNFRPFSLCNPCGVIGYRSLASRVPG